MSLVISAHTLASGLALQALASGGRMSQATAQCNVSLALAQTRSTTFRQATAQSNVSLALAQTRSMTSRQATTTATATAASVSVLLDAPNTSSSSTAPPPPKKRRTGTLL